MESQRADAGSTLHLVRDLIALRRGERDLSSGAYATLPAPDGVWAWRRGEGFAVAVDLGGRGGSMSGLAGEVVLGTDRARDGAAVHGAVELGAYEGVVVRLG